MNPVEEALVSLAEVAHRCPKIIHKFTADELTAWDRRHADIDALLDRLDQLANREPAAL